MQKIMPNLWFDKNAEEAMQFYVSVFSDILGQTVPSRIVSIKRYPDEAPADFMQGMEGKVLNGIMELAGHRFITLDGGPLFNFTPSISFFIRCAQAQEVDAFWERLSAGGTALMPLGSYPFSEKYGWLQDKYGVSWQIILGEGPVLQTIVPSLMFVGDKAGKAEEAMQLYTSLFQNASVGGIMRYEAGQEPDQPGTVAYGEFTLEGQQFVAMDSAQQHNFSFNEAVSLYVECESQAEVDRLWTALSAVPESEQCGWLKDRYGVSWQIIPRQMGEMIDDPDLAKSERVIKAMLQMKKIDLAQLEAAYQHQEA